MTRIISGKFRGKLIKAPLNLPVRPTTDFAKEGLFNILNNHFYFEEITVLDLFAGTGNLSYELASRGCEQITAVDQNPKCCSFIERTAQSIGFADILQVQRAEVLDFVKRDYRTYDLILADPPYDYTQYEELIEQIIFKKLLAEDGFLVLEHDRETDLSHLEHFYEVRNYGKVAFSFFSLAEESE
ncbi:16S rRNA (guanine(966)-N(2))-methyltransferase RsmD [Croceimicrobium hydrocarbonivorans]|uniref:16S rRNA (Guanine(966)-N(2))-methyltransferase RsmD n=1 Tax=Croceimicrobium hydrocarbonivorans TaxID=2761580 RepID=A0A7H0VCG8_9FLAO|nr:16S rRNA (guanine(966)-N(2))-methyltransferase RsmD [Croceimicrobium hydrocarbonivorans]QNR23416.1 16S rRNA (guanine(966)-N(2))-methyltransferase RsmD [Croceimicrobium hydrocarbonivorans]